MICTKNDSLLTWNLRAIWQPGLLFAWSIWQLYLLPAFSTQLNLYWSLGAKVSVRWLAQHVWGPRLHQRLDKIKNKTFLQLSSEFRVTFKIFTKAIKVLDGEGFSYMEKLAKTLPSSIALWPWPMTKKPCVSWAQCHMPLILALERQRLKEHWILG